MKAISSLVPPSETETAKILSLVDEMPLSMGKHDLYAIYRRDGGTVSWKVFRVAAAIRRGGSGADVELKRIMDEGVAEDARAAVRARTAAASAERAEREKKPEGGSMTVRREELSKGQRVHVRVRYADQVKLLPACINQVMRGAVNVSIDDENTPRTVRFNEIEVEEAPSPTLSAVPPAFAALEGHVERRVREDAERRQPPPAPALAATPSQPEDEVNAWIEKGASMRDNLATKQAALAAMMDELVLESLRIEEALAAKKAEHARITALLAALDQMRAAAA